MSTAKKESETIQTDHWTPLFTKDVIELIEGKREGHLGQWEYSEPMFEGDPVRGFQLWEEFLQANPEYYILSTELKLASKCAKILPKYITEPLAIAFLGVGTPTIFRQKDLTLTQNFQKVVSATTFDINSRYIRASLKELETARPKVIQGGYILDFFTDGFWFPDALSTNGSSKKGKPTRLATMFGGTLLNLEGSVDDGPPEKQAIERLKIIRKSLGGKNGGFLAITQDANEDPGKVEKAYFNQAAFAKNLVHRINRDTPYKFDPDKSEFRGQFHPDSHDLAHYLTLEGKDRPRTEYHFNNSYKIPNEIFTKWYEKAGFTSVHSEKIDDVYLHLLAS